MVKYKKERGAQASTEPYQEAVMTAFECSTKEGKASTEGYVLGYFAVHKGAFYSQNKGRWYVTHIPSGMALPNCCLKSKKAAMALVDNLLRLDIDFSNTEETRATGGRLIVPLIKEAMREQQ